MSIKVIIERQTIPGYEAQLNHLLTDLRSHAMQAKGYISGETLRSVSNPLHYIVISTWASADDWEAWAASDERTALQAKVDSLLQKPSTHRVYTHGD